jgi:hypothetical protein
MEWIAALAILAAASYIAILSRRDGRLIGELADSIDRLERHIEDTCDSYEALLAENSRLHAIIAGYLDRAAVDAGRVAVDD